jgi:hypothetical protein
MIPTSHELQREHAPRLKELPHEVLLALREHSKRMFGNQDRLEVAVATTRVALGKVNATDLHSDIDVAVNRIRAQLLVLESLGLLRRTANEDGKRMFERVDDNDRFWGFVVSEFESIERDHERATAPARPRAKPRAG